MRRTDSSHVSQFGSGYQYLGFGVFCESKNAFTDQCLPGEVTAWCGIDRQASSV